MQAAKHIDRTDPEFSISPLLDVGHDSNGNTDKIVDYNDVALVESLIRSVTEEESAIDALCAAVIAKDSARAERIANALTKLRGADKCPAP